MRRSTYNIFKILIELVILNEHRFNGKAKIILKKLSVLWKLFKITIDDEFEIIDNSDFVNRLRIYIRYALVNALEERDLLYFYQILMMELENIVDLSPKAKKVLEDFGLIRFTEFYIYKGTEKHNYVTGTDILYRFKLFKQQTRLFCYIFRK